MKTHLWLFAGVLALAPLTAVPASEAMHLQEPVPSQPSVSTSVVVGELGRRMHELVAAAEAVGFSGQVLVAVGGEPLLHKAYGYAEAAELRPMQLNTPIGIASMSKQFTAAMILELHAQGQLRLEDSLPLFFADVPADKAGITLRHLISHTSGLLSRYSEDFEPNSRELLIRGILETRGAFAPGARWRYSAAGYNLLAAVVEEVTKRPYEEAVRQMILEPAGMKSTGFLSSLPTGGAEVSHVYMGWDDRGSPADWPRNWRNFGAGDMVSTAADLFRWETALRQGRALSDEARSRFFQPLTDIGDNEAYGFGLFLRPGPDGTRMVEHGGDAVLGFNGSFFRYPDRDVVIVITCNARTPDGRFLRHAIGEGLEALALGRPTDASAAVRLPGRAVIEDLVGSYNVEGGGRLHIVTDGVHLWLAAGDAAGAALLDGQTGEGAADLARAETKTQALLRGLLDGDSTAYATALTADGMPHLASYVDEWTQLVASRGPLFDFHILGSRVDGSDVVTRARLRFAREAVTMTYFWRDRARGRLSGTFVGGSGFWPTAVVALAEPVVASGGGTGVLLGRDPMRATTRVEVRRQAPVDGRPLQLTLQLTLRIGERDIIAVSTGAAGWIPSFR